MTRTLICALGVGALVVSVPLQAAEDPGIALPSVPRAVLLAANDAPGRIRHVSADMSVEDAAPDVGEAPAATLALGPRTIRVSPGTTAIVEVAIDHLNRIVTPFTSPQVRSVSRATTQVDGNAIYVATASEEPVSLFITEAGDTATAISLTLAPRHIPPREVRLVLTGGVVPVRTTAPTIKPPQPLVRNDQPYVEHIAAAFRTLAQNRVPAGYELRKARRGERIACRQPGLSAANAQVFEGRGLRILAAKARNRGKQPIVLEEHRCSGDSGAVVAAVAAWPRSRLAPGEETELYVAVRAGESDPERGDDRPSLLGGL
jgi:conjugal transfer pilus assembly protein TraK